MTRARLGLLVRALAAAAPLFVLACAEATNQTPADQAVPCDAPNCGVCGSDKECGAGQCDPMTHACVPCVSDDHCPVGEVCAKSACLPGCSAGHGCGDAGVCAVDAGACVQCLGDSDCADPMKPRCDGKTSSCVPCLPQKDNCGFGEFCLQQNNAYGCVPGCKDDSDCTGGPDGGAGPVDGGSDGGAPAASLCDQTKHQCVYCLKDDQCPLGSVCHNGACAPGCNNQQACPNALTCCAMLCVDVTSDYQNCGQCGTACTNGWNCCGSACSNPANDAANCGGCGIACTVAHGTSGCQLRRCTLVSCDPGWADCDGSYVDGCEVNTDVSVANCGGCGNLCTLPNASPSCVAGKCQIAACALGFGDCDKQPQNGCEVNLFGDLASCGACGQACAPAHATGKCAVGQCQIASCAVGWLDCNGDPSDGCEVNAQTDPANCGSCNKVCSTQNGTPSCAAGACQIACAAGFGDCNGTVNDGCETNLDTDVQHCGACPTACSLPNATPSCAGGKCQVASCQNGFADCDGQPQDGCEVNTNSDVNNCSGCGRVCTVAHGSPRCTLGACQVSSCSPGFADCDGQAANGCEVDIFGDINNCNACGVVCAPQHATGQCQAGQCRVASCNAGFFDCNGSPIDGCEVNGAVDANNCGGCGRVCSSNNGTPSCVGSACQIACNAGFGNCDGNLANGCETNLNNDVSNCSACGNACNLPNANPSCQTGQCRVASCVPGFGDCDGSAANGCEVNLTNDVSNCNGCGNLCAPPHASGSCVASQCRIGACNAGFSDCDGLAADGCEINTQTDPNHCGTCGKVCSSNNGTPSCAGGGCGIACNPGFGNCDGNVVNGCETNLTNDPAHCGGCATVCTIPNGTPACVASSCAVAACNVGFANCDGQVADGCEINTTNDAMNCGGCNARCMLANASAGCAGSMCFITGCAPGFADCDGSPANGCEVNIAGDVNNCGGCGARCVLPNATAACTSSSCTISACNFGWADCNGNPADGCETNIATDPSHCGGCGTVCSVANGTAGCSNENCTVVSCNANFANCDGVVSNGCEVNLLTNLNHCGNCGTNCAALPQHTTSSACSSGACVVTGCQANFYDLINGFADGCECAGDAIGDLCTGPQILGALNPGQAVPASGNIAPGGDADWFQITFNGNVSQSYHPKVYLTTNPGSQFLFDVYAGACGSLLPCAEGGSVQGKTQWETLYTAGDPNSVGYQPIPAVGNGGTVLIKVYRANGFPVTCDGYILTISD